MTKSCGCLKSRSITERNIARTQHGQAKTHAATPTYRTWSSLIARCYNPKSDQYENYGGRGITVCDRWRTSFDNFFEDMGERPAGTTIDRKDVDGNYEPENCRWATSKQQCNNKRTNVKYTLNGNTHTLTEWADLLGVKVSALRMRLDDDWSIEKTLTTPVKKYRPRS